MLEDAQQAMVLAGEQLKSALDDVKGVGERAARAQQRWWYALASTNRMPD